MPTPEELAGGIPIEVPDGFEPLVGWRGWSVDRDENGMLILAGAHQREPWPPGTVTAAVCTVARPMVETILHNIPEADFAKVKAKMDEFVSEWAETWADPHDPPNESCRCGLYARFDRETIRDGAVWGQVQMWGKIVKHADGMRAQYARISGLLLYGREDEQTVRQLADRYAVPLLDDDRGRIPVHDIPIEHRLVNPFGVDAPRTGKNPFGKVP